MWNKALLSICLLSTSLQALEPARRIFDSLLLKETETAVQVAREWLVSQPSVTSYEMLIRSLAEAGEEQEMMEVWKRFHENFPEESMKRETLEQMCWGMLEKGIQAPGQTTQLIALIAAGLTQDGRAVKFIKGALNHSNARLRALAVKLASMYRDDFLCKEIKRLYKEENRIEVRQEVLQAIAEMRLDSLLDNLLQDVANPARGVDERKAAIVAVQAIQDSVSEQQLKSLSKSSRSGLRLIACALIGRLEMKERQSLLLPLTRDSHPDVQAAALQALGILKTAPETILKEKMQSSSPSISITAAWAALLKGEEEGQKTLKRWIEQGNEEERMLAVGAMVTGGSHAVSLAKVMLESNQDPYVRVNAALTLLRQRQECEKACKELDLFLRLNPEKLMWKEGFFSPLMKSNVLHNPLIPNYPEAVNQTVRLELLNLLCILEYPGAQELIKTFLKERRWKVTGLAAEILLGEGDETALALVRELLEDSDSELRSDAAFLLATWGHDTGTLPVLQSLYEKGDREQKTKVLESLARLEMREALPFLIDKLQEPSQTLRMMAACVIIRTLNH